MPISARINRVAMVEHAYKVEIIHTAAIAKLLLIKRPLAMISVLLSIYCWCFLTIACRLSFECRHCFAA